MLVSEGDHVPELPDGVLKERQGRLHRVEGSQGRVQHDAGVLTARVRHDGQLGDGYCLADDADAFVGEIVQVAVGPEAISGLLEGVLAELDLLGEPAVNNLPQIVVVVT